MARGAVAAKGCKETMSDEQLKTNATADMPWLISVDDHVTEPPDLWTSRLAGKYQDRAPRVHRDRILIPADAREMSGKVKIGDPKGRVADYWSYDGKPMRSGLLIPASHAVGLSGLTRNTTYYYRIVTRDAAGNTATSDVRSFTTTR